MKTSTVYIFLFFYLACGIIYGQDRKHIVTQSLFNPSEFKILNDSSLIISDNTFEYPLYMVNTSTDKIVNRVKGGFGPGELSSMYKNISISNDYIFVWDYGRQVLNYYNQELEYIDSKTLNNLGYIYNVIIGDNTILIIDGNKDFIKLYNYDRENIIGSEIKKISLSSHKNFKQFESIALRQAFKITTYNDNFFIVNEFTSLVFSLNKGGLNFVTSSPLNIVHEIDEGIYNITDLLYNELCSLDISVLEDKVYVLSKGEKANRRDITQQYENRINEYLEDFINTDNLLLYNWDGVYVNKLNLGHPIKKIEIHDKKLFYLQTVNSTFAVVL